MEPRKTPTTHSNLEKEDKVGGITLPDTKLCYKRCWLVWQSGNHAAHTTLYPLFYPSRTGGAFPVPYTLSANIDVKTEMIHGVGVLWVL